MISEPFDALSYTIERHNVVKINKFSKIIILKVEIRFSYLLYQPLSSQSDVTIGGKLKKKPYDIIKKMVTGTCRYL